MTQDEIDCFHLSTLKLSYEEAIQEYEDRANTRLGKLVANRELPILHRAKEIIDISFSNDSFNRIQVYREVTVNEKSDFMEMTK